MSDKLPRITATELLRALNRAGWFVRRQAGSHIIPRHPTRTGRVVVPMHKHSALRIGTLAQILKDAGLSVDELKELL